MLTYKDHLTMNEKYEIHERHSIQENILTEWTLRMMNNTLGNLSIYFIDGNSSHFTGQWFVVVQLLGRWHIINSSSYYYLHQWWLTISEICMVAFTRDNITGNARDTSLKSVPRWRHQMEIISALLALCVGNSPVNSPYKGQWRGALVFFLLSVPDQTTE